jgi:hypothetical protein
LFLEEFKDFLNSANGCETVSTKLIELNSKMTLVKWFFKGIIEAKF